MRVRVGPTRKTSSIRRLALLCTLFGAAAHAQSPSSADGYEITRSQTVTRATAGYVGRKTTDRQTRVGNTPDTDGNSSTSVLTFGGFVRECPTADGRVAGTFEFTLTSDEVDTDDGETQRRHHAISLVLELEGHTRPDGFLDNIDVRGEFSRQLHGTPAEHRSVRTTFRVGAQGQPDMAALEEAARATADVSVAAAMWMASTIYTDARNVWTRPNACVEIAFDPPTDSRFVGPNGSADVRVVVRTKEEKEPVGNAKLNIQTIGAIGTVTPREAVTDAGTPVTVTYTASANPRDGHGVDAAAAESHAGPGFGLWHIRAALPYEGTFTQKGTTAISGADLAEPFASSAQAYGMGVSRDEEISGRLVWTPEQSSSRAGSFGDVASAFYVPTAGEIRVRVHAEGRSLAGRCTHDGTKTFPIESLPPDALRYVLLEIAADGRYKLWLGMVSFYLQFEAEEKCEVRLARNTSGTVTINDAGIVLGLQEGVLIGDTISGETAAPIVFAPHRYTGNWEFKKQVEPRP